VSTALKNVLMKCGMKIWIVLDRLDEVFKRYSMVEFNGLRGLLRAYKSFELPRDGDIFRIKLFLRDDIKAFLTDEEAFKSFYPKKSIPPLVAATHMFAKESPVLIWTEDQIEQLILYRLFQSDELKKFVELEASTRVELEAKLRSPNTRS